MKEKLVSIERGCFNFEGSANFFKKSNHILAGQIKEFSLDDLEFDGTSSSNPIKISEVEQEFLESNFVPLDIYCAEALYAELKNDLGFAWDVFNKTTFPRIYFVGSTLEKKNSIDHKKFYLCIDYPDGRFNNPVLSVCEDNEFDLSNDCLAVFKKSFIEKEELRIKEAAKEKKIRPWPSLSDCQSAVIERLKKENSEIKLKYGELEKKYKELLEKTELKSPNIVKPPFSDETIALLCKRVCDFDLSARIIHAIDDYEIIYLFQLICFSKTQLERIRNIYKKSIKEIIDFLESFDLTLETKLSPEEINFFWKKVEGK